MSVQVRLSLPQKQKRPFAGRFCEFIIQFGCLTSKHNLTIIKIFVKSISICYNLTMKTLTTKQFDEILKLTLESVKASDQTTVLKRNGCYNGKKIRSHKTANTLVKHNDTSH